MPSRRRYLALLGAGLAATAGCLSDGDGGATDTQPHDTTRPPTTDTTAPPTTTHGTTRGPGTTTGDPVEGVTVSDLGVVKAGAYYAWPYSTEVYAPPGKQFVVASVRMPGGRTAPGFSFRAAGETYQPGIDGVDSPGWAGSTFAGREGGLVAGQHEGSGYLAFTVPSPIDAADPRIRLDAEDRAWPLPDAARERLATPSPSFRLDGFEAPDSVERPHSVDVSLTVTNTSDVDGRFVAGLHWPTNVVADDDETHVLRQDVAAGASSTLSRTLGTEYATFETDTLTLSLGGYVSAAREVTVEADGTTTR
jgi:hypothetical protein